MNNTLLSFPKPENEPVLGYAPGSPERAKIREALDALYKTQYEICPIIGGKKVKTKETGTIVMPTENKHVLAKYYKVGEKEVKAAIAENRPEGCYILIKGSNSNKLVQTVELL